MLFRSKTAIKSTNRQNQQLKATSKKNPKVECHQIGRSPLHDVGESGHLVHNKYFPSEINRRSCGVPEADESLTPYLGVQMLLNVTFTMEKLVTKEFSKESHKK